jgi:hypothetical protein
MKRHFFDHQRPCFLRYIETRNDIDGDVESNLRRWEVILCKRLGAGVHDRGGQRSGRKRQYQGNWLRGNWGEARPGAAVAHLEGTGSRMTRAGTRLA